MATLPRCSQPPPRCEHTGQVRTHGIRDRARTAPVARARRTVRAEASHEVLAAARRRLAVPRRALPFRRLVAHHLGGPSRRPRLSRGRPVGGRRPDVAHAVPQGRGNRAGDPEDDRAPRASGVDSHGRPARRRGTARIARARPHARHRGGGRLVAARGARAAPRTAKTGRLPPLRARADRGLPQRRREGLRRCSTSATTWLRSPRCSSRSSSASSSASASPAAASSRRASGGSSTTRSTSCNTASTPPACEPETCRALSGVRRRTSRSRTRC